MPKKQDPFDLEKLRTDPELWKRLATPAEGSNKMGNVFLDRENPFTNAGEVAMSKVRTLAEEGKLYVREFGRSRHFRKVEQENGEFRLGEQKEAKTAGPYDPVFGSLLRVTRWYFRSLGLERLTNWIDRYAQKYDTYRALDKQYKSEYDSLSKDDKKALKQKRKQEKEEKAAREKLEQLLRDTEKAREALDKVLGQKEKATPSQAAHPEKIPQEKLPEQNEREQPQSLRNNEADAPMVMPAEKEESQAAVQPGPQKEQEQPAIGPEAQQAPAPSAGAVLQEQPAIGPEAQQAPAPSAGAVLQEQPALGPEAQQAPAPSAGAGLQEQLAIERDAQQGVKHWKDTLTNTLFHWEKNQELHGKYRNNKDDAAVSRTVLTGTVAGLLGMGGEAKENPEDHKQMFECLLSGKPMSPEMARDGFGRFDAAWNELHRGNAAEINRMLSNSIRKLSREASAEETLSYRHVMIGRLISETFRLAKDTPGIKLDLSKKDLTEAKGALGLSVLAEKGLQARQHLGSMANINFNEPETANAVRDLLSAKGIEYNMKQNRPDRGEVSPTQILIGAGILSPGAVNRLTNTSDVRQSITEERIWEILNEPNGKTAMKTGHKLADHYIGSAILAVQKDADAPEKTMQLEEEMTQKQNVQPMPG